MFITFSLKYNSERFLSIREKQFLIQEYVMTGSLVC